METTSSNEIPPYNPYPDQPQQPTSQSIMPVLAGIFLILSGLLGVLTWASALAVDMSMIQGLLPPDSPFTANQLQSMISICGIIGSILSIIALAGGIVALRRRGWELAMIGSVLGLFTIGPLFLASILALISLLLLIVSRNEFQKI